MNGDESARMTPMYLYPNEAVYGKSVDIHSTKTTGVSLTPQWAPSVLPQSDMPVSSYDGLGRLDITTSL